MAYPPDPVIRGSLGVQQISCVDRRDQLETMRAEILEEMEDFRATYMYEIDYYPLDVAIARWVEKLRS